MTVVINSAERFDVGVVFTATDGVCESGTATTIAISVGIPTTITLLMAPNTFYDIQIIGNKNETATIDLSVLTSQLGTRTINS